MKTYLQMDGDQLVEYVEKRELGELISLLASEKCTRNYMIKRNVELERERDALKAEIESMREDIEAALIMIEKMEKNDWDELRK